MQDFRCSHWCSWRCKPFSLWHDISFVTGLIDSPLRRRCGAEEETAHDPCEYKALTSLRHAYLGSVFLNPEDVMSLILGAKIKNFSKGTGLPWLWHQIMGHKRACPKRPTCNETERTQTHLLFCFILFRLWHITLQRVRMPSYSESSRWRINVWKAAPMIARYSRRFVWIFVCIISVTQKFFKIMCEVRVAFCITVLLRSWTDTGTHFTTGQISMELLFKQRNFIVDNCFWKCEPRSLTDPQNSSRGPARLTFRRLTSTIVDVPHR
jgi:hypothetical protein